MKKIIITFFAIALFIPQVYAATFTDVPADHEYYEAIESLKNLEIVKGYDDNTFKPEQAVNRVEALKMILKSAEVQILSSYDLPDFTDMELEAWYLPYVATAGDLGIVNGNPDGTFAPGRRVNKAEFLKMLIESFAKDISLHENLTTSISSDTKIGDWYIPYLSYAKTIGIIFPTIENALLPSKELNRGETAEIIYKLLIVEQGGDTQKMLNIAEASLINVLINLNDNDISTAIDNANNAVFYTEQALHLNSDESIIIAANKIALGFRELCYAYQSGLTSDTETLKAHANQAKTHANEATAQDPSTQSLADNIIEQADILLSQI